MKRTRTFAMLEVERCAAGSPCCLIPASGFYEWQRLERGKQPFFVRMRDERLFAFAGLWDRWESPDKDVIETCTILTTAANTVLAPIHDRMPVIVPPGEYDRWLDPALKNPGSLAPLLVPFPPDGMLAFPVSTRVNTPSIFPGMYTNIHT